MKKFISGAFLLSCASYLMVNCITTNSVTKPTTAENNNPIDLLRKLYSSGDSKNWPKPNLDESSKIGFVDIGHLPEVQFPADNQYSKEKEELGKTLFYDPRLSQSNQIACASCHDPELAWTDNKTLSFGHNRQLGSRNAMSILNSAYATSLFWDGRAKSLEDQAQQPVTNPVEMNEHLDLAVEKIAKIKGYQDLFKKAFGSSEINEDKITKSIATFERTIKSGSTKFDRFIDGKSEVYSDSEVNGLNLFRTKARCINCHNTGYFSDNKFENDGTALLGSKLEDLGRYNVTKNLADLGKFRVPTLREVARTGPWMHNGSFTPLRDVLTFYNAGNPEIKNKDMATINGVKYKSPKSKKLQPLNLTKDEIEDLEAFLETLSSRPQRIIVPELPQ